MTQRKNGSEGISFTQEQAISGKVCGRFVEPAGSGFRPPGGILGDGAVTDAGLRVVSLIE